MIFSLTYLLLAISAIHIMGVICVVHAVLNARSSQGSVAWASSLLLLPYVAVPLYLVFGRSYFRGYLELESQTLNLDSIEGKKLKDQFLILADSLKKEAEPSRLIEWERIFSRPFLGSNEVDLLIDGEETFSAIEESINQATQYILFQFFIIRSDGLGDRLSELLQKKARQGVRVHVLYDEVGCAALPKAYLQKMQQAGINVSSFNTTRGIFNKLQLNFRNHRKIVVVDGRIGFVGGHNVGDEYLGKNPRIGKWHDFHVKIVGPETAALQIIFLRDWYWATRNSIEVKWDATRGNGKASLMSVATGPSDQLEKCSMIFVNAINSAKQRIWIVSPYFVPNEPVLLALQLAATRGVDVRILLPKRPDHLLVWLASFAYVPHLLQAGVRVFRYPVGFLHGKSFLMDDVLAMVGTPNLDNRSLKLNFEVSLLVDDSQLCNSVETMLRSDFSISEEENLDTVKNWPFHRRVAGKVARLFSPIL